MRHLKGSVEIVISIILNGLNPIPTEDAKATNAITAIIAIILSVRLKYIHFTN